MSLRTRLTLSIGLLVLVSVAALGLAVYNLVGSRLDDRVDSELQDQVDALGGTIADAPAGTEATAARRFIDGQALAGSRLLVAQVPGVAAPISNQSNLLDPADGGRSGEEHAEDGEEERERVQVRELLAAAPGFATIDLPESGELRLLTRTVPTGAGTVVVQAGELAAATDQAQRQVAKTYLLIGSLTVLAAAGLGLLIATRTARPLERMAGRAHELDAGRLELRMDEHTRVTEIAALADSFDRMLDRLEAAFHAQRAFVADASHELRTPLTAIRGHVSAIREGVIDDPVLRDQSLGVIGEEAMRLERLVGDVLDLAKLDAHRFTVLQEEVDMEQLSRRAFAAFGEEARKQQIDYRLAVDAQPVIISDGDRVLQIIVNLLSNAFRWTPAGGRVELTLSAQNGSVSVAVADTGPGISAEERERIFRPFVSQDGAGGTGLGLAIAAELVAVHGGRLELLDREKGATFLIELPDRVVK
jgi:signal transduction histidine kinase